MFEISKLHIIESVEELKETIDKYPDIEYWLCIEDVRDTESFPMHTTYMISKKDSGYELYIRFNDSKMDMSETELIKKFGRMIETGKFGYYK